MLAGQPARRRAEARTPPPDRDRFADALRVFALLAIITQCWLLPLLSPWAVPSGPAGAAADPAGVGETARTMVMWTGIAMPLLFFATGVGAGRTADRLGRRLSRLAWPALPLVAIWLPLPRLITPDGLAGDSPEQLAAQIATHVAGQALAFLVGYVTVTAATPALLRLHRRWRGAEIVALAAAALLVDAVRAGEWWTAGAADQDALGYGATVLVWLAAHQVGIAAAAGRLATIGGGLALKTAAAGFITAAVTVLFLPHPAPTIIMPGTSAVVTNPPAAAMLALTVGHIGTAQALRPAITWWTTSRPVAGVLDTLPHRLLAVYLWCAPAPLIAVDAAVAGFGLTLPEPLTAPWRQLLPWWLLALAGTLSALVRAVGRLEGRRVTAALPRTPRIPGSPPLPIRERLIA